MNDEPVSSSTGSKPGPAVLWAQAEREHPHDVSARRTRYHELMVEHGHIVKREPGQSVNLPCGWPHRPEPEDVG